MSMLTGCPSDEGVTIAYRTARCLTPDPTVAEELVLQTVARAMAEPAGPAVGSDATLNFLTARLTVAELARIDALPLAGARVRLHRGRRLLSQALGEQSAVTVSRGEHP
jgi:hypothetical protein